VSECYDISKMEDEYIFYRCYNLILDKTNQMNWNHARERCQASGGDLLVFRSDYEVVHKIQFV
jgi:hypothetical protein